MQKVLILGFTGSVGQSAARVLRAFEDKFAVCGFSYHGNFADARKLQSEFNVHNICCTANSVKEEKNYWKSKSCNFFESMKDLLDIEYDSILTAIVGACGVRPVLKAAKQGKKIMLANKESLVMSGEFLTDTAEQNGSILIPVDSEHNSLFRLLHRQKIEDFVKIILTASGGPLKNKTPAEIRVISKSEVLNHPTWNMGDKITVDSAGMINKALETIEAHHLFNTRYEDLDAIIHTQSFIHAITKHKDGSSFFHVSRPDMIYPVAYALFYPDEPEAMEPAVEIHDYPDLTFEKVDRAVFPGYYLGLEAGRKGKFFPAIFNAANEAAVDLFLKDQIKFHEIPVSIDKTLSAFDPGSRNYSLDELFEVDAWSREEVNRQAS